MTMLLAATADTPLPNSISRSDPTGTSMTPLAGDTTPVKLNVSFSLNSKAPMSVVPPRPKPRASREGAPVLVPADMALLPVVMAMVWTAPPLKPSVPSARPSVVMVPVRELVALESVPIDVIRLLLPMAFVICPSTRFWLAATLVALVLLATSVFFSVMSALFVAMPPPSTDADRVGAFAWLPTIVELMMEPGVPVPFCISRPPPPKVLLPVELLVLLAIVVFVILNAPPLTPICAPPPP